MYIEDRAVDGVFDNDELITTQPATILIPYFCRVALS